MAEIKQIFFHQDIDKQKRIMRVYGIFRSIGEKMIEVQVPEKFYEAILGIARAALDTEEAKIRAELLGETTQPTDGSSK